MGYIINIILISKGTIYIEMYYDHINTLNPEREKFTKETMFLRSFLILKVHYKPNGLWPLEYSFNPKGHKKMGKKTIVRQHKLKGGEERKVL
jgi:hypothetical protein